VASQAGHVSVKNFHHTIGSLRCISYLSFVRLCIPCVAVLDSSRRLDHVRTRETSYPISPPILALCPPALPSVVSRSCSTVRRRSRHSHPWGGRTVAPAWVAARRSTSCRRRAIGPTSTRRAKARPAHGEARLTAPAQCSQRGDGASRPAPGRMDAGSTDPTHRHA
jgi:hypothetical protein